MMTRHLAGHEVGAVGLGCMSFGGMYGATDTAESRACLDAALAAGVTHWDVAEVYGRGRCEEILGDYLADTGAEVVIATKAGIYRDAGRPFQNDAAALRRSLEGSLRRLKRERVELFYVHRREAAIPIEEVMETLAALKAEGKIGGIGLSEVSPATLRRAAAVHPVDAVQSEYSLWTRQPELGMLQACAALGTAFVAFSPVARGMMSDTLPVPADFPEGDIRINMPRFREPDFSANVAAIAPFRDWCAARGWATAAVAMAWCLSRGPHVIPIPGTRSAAHLRELAAGTELEFGAGDLEEIDDMLPPGFAHGDRYAPDQYGAVERYC